MEHGPTKENLKKDKCRQNKSNGYRKKNGIKTVREEYKSNSFTI